MMAQVKAAIVKALPWRVQRDFQRNETLDAGYGQGCVVANRVGGKEKWQLSISSVPGACGSHFIYGLGGLAKVPVSIAKKMIQWARRVESSGFGGRAKVMLICTTASSQPEVRTRLEELGFIASPEGVNANSGNGVMAHVKVF